MESERYSRNVGLFGVEGQQKIAATRVSIVGLGGLGSHVAQQLAYLGVLDVALIDFDVVTSSSMNRLVGAVDADVVEHRKKIAVAARQIQSVQSGAKCKLIDASLDAVESEAAIARSDVVFGCLDGELGRLRLTETCTNHARPLFDLATDTGGEGNDSWYGGRVVFANGSGCLVCYGILDQRAMATESLPLEQRDAHDRIYGVDRQALQEAGPMVVSVNGVIASLAVTEFMAFVTEMRPPASQLIYRGEKSIVRLVVDAPSSDCYFCKGIWGSRRT